MSTPNPRSPLLSVAETAEALAVSEQTVRRLVGCGEIPAVRVARSVRVDFTELTDWLFRDAADGGISAARGPAGGTPGFTSTARRAERRGED